VAAEAIKKIISNVVDEIVKGQNPAHKKGAEMPHKF